LWSDISVWAACVFKTEEDAKGEVATRRLGGENDVER